MKTLVFICKRKLNFICIRKPVFLFVYEKLGLQNMKELGMSRTDSELAISLVFTENDLEEIQLLGRETLLNVIVAEE